MFCKKLMELENTMNNKTVLMSIYFQKEDKIWKLLKNEGVYEVPTQKEKQRTYFVML
jgi:hypothetical protein